MFVVYDVSDKESFDKVTDWIRQIDIHCQPGVQKLLIANKIDLPED